MSGSFARRDQLLEIQREAQSIWESQKAFEIDAPDGETTPKFICSFPYPYMNGFLHVGHAFTVSKTEFATGYERLKGKNALFPFGFHCTGMPIQACANKLKRELEEFGNPPKFPVDNEKPDSSQNVKSKVAAKTGKVRRQWDILLQSGIEEGRIHKFADPMEWLHFFPQEGMNDLKALGAKVDWRRSFITTKVNPFYDSFIRWQFNLLRSLEKVKFGKRYAVWSPLDDQVCADHDRASGEGVGPQEYTIIKMRVKGTLPSKLEELKNDAIYLGAATLRPETMYGQTNCWALPDGDYGAYRLANNEIVIMSERAAMNMAYQGMFPKFGEAVEVAKLKGTDLLGLALEAPNAILDTIYVLPLMTISTAKGTGIVTSVPSDAPDDYRGLMDLKEKEALRSKFGIKDEWVMPFEPVPIIEIPELGNLAAIKACEMYKVRSQNDKDALQKAKEDVYKKGFYGGKMIVGEHKGDLVETAKSKIKEEMLQRGQALRYCEPEKTVMSRSGDECVVALVDQWYLDYGEPGWRKLAEECLGSMETYSSETRHGFESTLRWLHEWACTRQYGLGTMLPWDPQWVIESLSDSTIYMAYYTVAHLLQGIDNLGGSKPGPLNIRAEQLTDAVWSHILLKKDLTEEEKAKSGISGDALQKLRAEFEYWYPLDLRVSGKDLVPNHLTFFIYNHTAIFPRELWPKAVRANGHILVDAEKMSKQTGNFITLRDAVNQNSADAVRFALADAGDLVEDANFSTETVSKAILKLTTLITFAKEGLEVIESMQTGPLTRFADKAFDAQLTSAIEKADEAYRRMLYREALKVGFHELQDALGRYRVAVGADKVQASFSNMHKGVFLRFLETQIVLLAPICPHTAEHLYGCLHKGRSVMSARWPEQQSVDESLLLSSDYLDSMLHRMRLNVQTKSKKGKKGQETPKPDTARIYVCEELPQWQKISLEVLRENFDRQSKSFPKDLDKRVAAAMPPELKKMMKKIMPYVGMIRDMAKEKGESALEGELRYNEMDVLNENAGFIKEQLELKNLDVRSSKDPAEGEDGAAADSLPAKPSFLLRAS